MKVTKVTFELCSFSVFIANHQSLFAFARWKQVG